MSESMQEQARTSIANNATSSDTPNNDLPSLNNNSGGFVPGGFSATAASTALGTGTTTMVITTQRHDAREEGRVEELPVLRLSLRPRVGVTWDESVINNEGLGRKSSKRCCIFHKQRPFGESSTESSEDDDNDSGSSSSSGGGGSGRVRKVARKKSGKNNGRGGISGEPKVPDYQRYHA